MVEIFGPDDSADTCVPPPAGLVSWWPGDGNAQDIIGPNDGTLQGGATFAPGMVGEAFKLNGGDQFVEVPSTNVLYDAVSGFTWEVWVRPAALEEMVVFGAADDVLCEDLDVRIGGFAEAGIPPNHVVARVDPVGECEARQFFSAPVPGGIQPGTNYHLALTVDYPNNTARLYVNGQEVASTNLMGTPIARNMLVTIGAFRDENQLEFLFNGLIDEVSVYNHALSAEEIQAIFNAGSAGKCKPTNRSCQGGRSHIRGLVTTAEDTTGVPDITVDLEGPGACRETTTTKALGFYLFPHLREGAYTVTPSDTECTFDPPNWTVTLEEDGRARLNFAADCP